MTAVQIWDLDQLKTRIGRTRPRRPLRRRLYDMPAWDSCWGSCCARSWQGLWCGSCAGLRRPRSCCIRHQRRSAAAGATRNASSGGLINVNTASLEDYSRRFPALVPSKAAAIIAEAALPFGGRVWSGCPALAPRLSRPSHSLLKFVISCAALTYGRGQVADQRVVNDFPHGAVSMAERSWLH